MPGVRFPGLIHPGLIGCLPDPKLLKTWNDREIAFVDAYPDRVPPVANKPFPLTAHMGRLKGDARDGSWMIPASKVGEYPDEVFVERIDEETGVRGRVRYDKGSFVYRLAGRDRQTSASFYTPQSLTEVTVQLALKYRLEEAGREVPAGELLDWTICEPALGSGAFLNEAINQVAAEYAQSRGYAFVDKFRIERLARYVKVISETLYVENGNVSNTHVHAFIDPLTADIAPPWCPVRRPSRHIADSSPRRGSSRERSRPPSPARTAH